MRQSALSLLVLWTLTLAGYQSKSAKVKPLQDQYNAEYPAYAKQCIDPVTAGSSEPPAGEKLTSEQIAALEPRRKNEMRGVGQKRTALPRFKKELLLRSSSAVLL